MKIDISLLESLRYVVSKKNFVNPDHEREQMKATEQKPISTEFGSEYPVNYLDDITEYHKKFDVNVAMDSNIPTYRKMANDSEIDDALDEIVNEMYSQKENVSDGLEIDLSATSFKEPKLKSAIEKAFEDVLSLLEFPDSAHTLIRKWFVDGRLCLELVYRKNASGEVDEKAGIYKIRILDPTKLTEVLVDAENKSVTPYSHGVYNSFLPDRKLKLMYQYDVVKTGKSGSDQVLIDPNFVFILGSGYIDEAREIETSYLSKAIRAWHNLLNIEGSVIVNRLVNASNKKVFNVEVGNLTPKKQDSYMSRLVSKFNTKLEYNRETGEVYSGNSHMAMTESYWFPKNGQGKGTTVDMLSGASNLSEIDDVHYFQKKLWRALGVPESRRSQGDQGSIFEVGRTTQLSMEERKFFKFILKLRKQFGKMFLELVKRQCLVKNIFRGEAEFEKERHNISFRYPTDNYYTELHDFEIEKNRYETLVMMEPYIGKFTTRDKIATEVLKYTEGEWKKIKKEMEDPVNKQWNAQMGDEGENGGYNPFGGDKNGEDETGPPESDPPVKEPSLIEPGSGDDSGEDDERERARDSSKRVRI